MKNKLIKIQRNGGYVFNSNNGQLEMYEFISCKFNFKGSVQYKCKLGGVETTIEDEDLKVYENESVYKENIPLPPSNFNFDDAMNRSYKFHPKWNSDEIPYAWEYKNGNAVQVDISGITFTDIGEWAFEKDENYQIYKSHSQVFDFHDLVIKEEDGSIKVRKSPASKLKFNNEQMVLIEELQLILQKLDAANVKILFDEDRAKLHAMSMVNIQNVENWEDFDDSYTQIKDMVTEIECNYIATYNSGDYGLHVTFKE
jgi:hypothetical protein